MAKRTDGVLEAVEGDSTEDMVGKVVVGDGHVCLSLEAAEGQECIVAADYPCWLFESIIHRAGSDRRQQQTALGRR